MNEQLQGKLVEILSSIQSAAKAGGDFALSQLPDIAQSYVLYGRVSSTVSLVLGALVLTLSVYAALRFGFLNRSAVRTDVIFGGDWKTSRLVATLVGSLISAFAFLHVCLAISDVALVWLAPKVWLLKEIAGLLNGHR